MEELDSIFDDLKNDLRTRFDLIISICNSPIEKLFVARVYSFFFTRHFPISILTYNAENLILAQRLGAIGYNQNNDFYLTDQSVGHFYHPLYGTLERVSGLFIEGININYSIYPQKAIHDHTRLVYADFAMIVRDKSNEIVGKFVIECDGFRWHNTPDQLTRDNLRNRFITRHGYHIIRYTGREISRFNDRDVLHLENTICRSIFNDDSEIYKWEIY